MKLKKILLTVEKNLGDYDEIDKENNGLVLGNNDKEIKDIYICWKITEKVINNIKFPENSLIITHEPYVYKIKSTITKINNYQKEKLEKKLFEKIKEKKINLARYHLSLDSSQYGINKGIIRHLDLKEIENYSYYSVCELKKNFSTLEFAKYVKEKLGSKYVKIVGNNNLALKKIIIIAGGGSTKEFIAKGIEKQCDAIISGDSTTGSEYFAYENDIALIDPGHKHMEIPGIKLFFNKLKKDFNGKGVKVRFLKNENISKII